MLLPACLAAFSQEPDYNKMTPAQLDSLLYGAQRDSLEEIVVVGYGYVRKSDLTGAVSSLRLDEGEASRASSLDQLLQGRAAGVQVLRNGGSPDGGISVRIRGLSSFNSSSEPLYVVDGVLLNTSQGGETLLSRGADNGSSDEAINGLMGLSPSDIQSVEILKDASATAIYGALGANGVVLITTKTGTKERPVVRFTAGVDVNAVSKRIDVLTFDEYVQYLEDTRSTAYLNEIYEDPETRTGLKVTPLDWQEVCLRNAVSQRYNLAIYGKPKSLAYAFSLSYNDNMGVIQGTGVRQYIGRLNLDWTVSPKFKLGSRFNMAHIHSDMTQSTGGGRMSSATSLARSMISYRPYFSDIDLEDQFNYDDGDEDLKASPYRWMDKTHFSNDRKDYRITPTLYAELQLTPWLQFKSTIGLDYRNSGRRKFKSSAINTTSSGSAGALGTYEYFNWNWDNLLMFSKRWRGHSLSGTVGSTLYSRFAGTQTVEGWNIDQFKGGLDCINYAPNRRQSYDEAKSTTLSFFARAIYNYKDRYVLTSTFRADGSSKFFGTNKWGFFPSFAFAWRASQEPWFQSSWISSLKLRAGWGRVGDQSIADYQTSNQYTISAISAHDPGNTSETSVTVTPANFANPLLRWETTEQLNGGLDLSLWNGRLSIVADGYMKTTFDLLQSKEIPASSGMTSYYVNEGTIRNVGFDAAAGDKLVLSLHAIPLKDEAAGDTYRAQIAESARLLAEALDMASDDIVVAFQSVFGHDESKWTSPLTRDVLKGWRDGDFRVVLACPGFAIDCLETLYDIPHIMVPALEGEGAAPVVEHVDGDIQAACNTRGRFVWAPTLNASDEHAALIKGVLVKAICP